MEAARVNGSVGGAPKGERPPTLEEAQVALRRFKVRGLIAFAFLGLSLVLAFRGLPVIWVYVPAIAGIVVYLTVLPERRVLQRYRRAVRDAAAGRAPDRPT